MAFEKNWRDRYIIHRTPGGKLSRVKISSLPAKEQQKYNPNRFKRDKDSNTDYEGIQRRDVETGHIFDFYIQVDDPDEYIDDMDDDDTFVATTDSSIVSDYFDDDKTIIKLKGVPMEAVKEVAVSDDDDDIDFEDIDFDNLEFKNIDDLEDEERYEKIKFNSLPIYKIAIKPYLDFIEVVIDTPESEDDDLEELKEGYEGFYNFYYI